MLVVVDGFRCKRCNGTTQEHNVAEYLVVDGEMYQCEKGLYYMGDTRDGDSGGADLTETTRIRGWWMRFR